MSLSMQRMDESTISANDLWSRRFFHASSLALEPMCTIVWCAYRIIAPLDKFDCRANRVSEVALRALYLCEAVALAIPATALAMISSPLRCIAKMVQQNGYTHVCGNLDVAEKKFNDSSYRVKVMTCNIAGVPAGISYQVAGMPHWKSRIDQIITMIRDSDPDVLVIQEAYDTLVQEELVSRLKDRYPHFFLHLGIGKCGGMGPGGLFMATKGAVAHFSDHPFYNNSTMQCRSFGSLELFDQPGGKPFARFIGTHPVWRADEPEKREQQWLQIQTYIQERNQQGMLPTIIAADTNCERDRKEGQQLKKWADPYYRAPAPTCWHKFPLDWKYDDQFQELGPNRPRQIDNILHVRIGPNVSCISCDRIESYRDDYSKRPNDSRRLFDSSQAASDHHFVLAELQFQPVA